MRAIRRSLFPLNFALLAVVACGGGDGPTAPAAVLTLAGHLERGDSAQVVVSRDGVTIPVGGVAFQFLPSTTAHLLPSGWVRFDASGPLTVAATLPDGEVTQAGVTIATPPLVVFDYVDAGNRDIYVVAIDGNDLRRLTTNAGDDQHPSAAAGSVVFTSYRNGNAEVYSMPFAGGTERRLTTSATNETEPALSPDGTRIAYVSNSGGLARLWLASSEGTGAAIVATGGTSSTIEAQPTWSRTGDRIAFTSTLSGNASLYQLTVSGGAVALIPGASTNRPEAEAAWSNDGATLYFVSDRTTESGLFQTRLPDATATLLVSGTVGQPTVLADGRIVFTEFDRGKSSLRWIDPAAPTVRHNIVVGTGNAAHPAAVRVASP